MSGLGTNDWRLLLLATGLSTALGASCSNSSFNGTGAGAASPSSASPAAAGSTDASSKSGAPDADASGNGGAPGTDAANAGPALGNVSGSANATVAKSGVPTVDLNPNGTLRVCPQNPQHILILDFKSGWWSGDGGDFVDKITSGLATPCGSAVTLEYHHIVLGSSLASIFGGGGSSQISNMQLLVPSSPNLHNGNGAFAQAFADPTWASYTQIWLLSGSSADSEDLQINDPFFVQVLTQLAASKANFFIGVGYGSISHGVAAAKALKLGASFSTAQPEGNILDPMSGVTLATSLSGTALNLSAPLLVGLSSIADDVVVAGVSAHGDAIVDQGGITVLGTDHHKQTTLATATTATARVVLDSDMPRYYAAWSNQSADTMRLLQNVLTYLSN